MNCYINKNQIRDVLQKVRTFEMSLNALFADYGYDLNENLGRRNALLSQSQEKELANVLRAAYGADDIIDDGRPGKPDILIKSLGRELECKLTSGHGKHKSFGLQTDYATLVKKRQLDYLYILSNPEFNKFCVIFFDSLTPDDFFVPANGSRGKSRMNKKRAMEKATVLWGGYTDLSIENYSKWADRLESTVQQKTRRIGELNYKLKQTPPGASSAMGRLATILKKEEDRYDKKIKKIVQKIEYWEKATPRFSYIFEEA